MWFHFEAANQHLTHVSNGCVQVAGMVVISIALVLRSARLFVRYALNIPSGHSIPAFCKTCTALVRNTFRPIPCLPMRALLTL